MLHYDRRYQELGLFFFVGYGTIGAQISGAEAKTAASDSRQNKNAVFRKEKITISLYQFIASEYELPALLSPKLHYPDGRDKKFESLDDLGDLEIVQEMIGYLFVDITAYTKLKNIYRLNLDYTPERGQRLYEYLKQNCQPGQRCEVWTIDMAAQKKEDIQEQLVHLQRACVTADALTMELVAQECDHQKFEAGDYPRMLIIQ